MREWLDFSFVLGRKAHAPGPQFLSDRAHGVWGLAQDYCETDTQASTSTSQASTLLLDSIREQVASGEDLTAAMLVGHGRVAREQDVENPQGAQVIAMRLNRQSSSFEVAWVGPMRAYLIRKKEALLLTPGSNDDEEIGETRTNSLLMTATRVSALGTDARVRPVISRKLGHAQSGDTLVLLGAGIDENGLGSAFASGLSGMWSFDYKVRTLQSLLEKRAALTQSCPVMICRAK